MSDLMVSASLHGMGGDTCPSSNLCPSSNPGAWDPDQAWAGAGQHSHASRVP